MTKRKTLHVFTTQAAAAVLAIALFGGVPAAQAQSVTNPADHPAPVTVKIDGQTYHDGLDTLPGYDDEACTPIPNVQYDFANDEIQYYSTDGEVITTAHWTEWSRISSYETWQAQQHAATPTPTPTTAATATPAPSSTVTTSPSTTNSATTSPSTTNTSTAGSTTKSPSTKSSTTKSSSTKSSTTKSPSTNTSSTTSSSSTSPSSGSTTSNTSKHTTSSSGDQRDTSTASPTSDGTAANDAATAAPAANGATVVDTAGTAPPVAGSNVPVAAPTSGAAGGSPASSQETAKFKLASQQLGAAPVDTRLAGVGILAALFGVAGLGLMFRGIARRQGFGRQH